MRRAVVIAVCACAAVAVYALARPDHALPPEPPQDEVRWVPVADEDLFKALGARVIRVHIPANALQGKKRLVFVQEDSRREQPFVAETVLSDRAAGPVEAALLLQFDGAEANRATHYTRVFVADATRFTTSGDNPVVGFNVYESGRGLSDIAGSGVQLCAFAKTDGNDTWRVRFLLRLE